MSHAAVAIPGLDRMGGAERQAMVLAKGLCRRGWRVSMVALSGTGGAAATELRDSGVAFISLEMRKGLADPRGWLRFHRWLWREQPDVVHAHLPHAAWLARWSRLIAPVPVVIDTLHSSYTGKKGRRIGYGCSRWLPDHVTAVSGATAASHLAAGMAREEDLSVLSNGIDVATWRPDVQVRSATRRALGLGDEFLWIAVGRLEAVKDYQTLLRAFSRLQGYCASKPLKTGYSFPETAAPCAPATARLLMLGAGPLQAELVELTAQLGLEQRVHFFGFEPNVRRWMQAADGFVLSSRYEGLPMVLLEAGACGLPTVATDVAGTREVIVDGENGCLAPAGNPHALASAMAWLMHVPIEERRAMGECARRRVVEQFGLETVLDRWERLYEDLLRRKSGEWPIRPAARESLSRRSAASA
jgi:glycosyltransferase involved in cell wall biosynthesis